MNIALIQAPVKFIRESKDVPKYQHIGLGYIASSLEKSGFNTKVIDAKLECLTIQAIMKRIEKFLPKIVGLTAMTHEIEMANLVAVKLKELLPNAIFIVGGVHLSLLPDDTLNRYKIFDLGVIGEAEIVMLEIAKRVDNSNLDFSDIEGIVYRENGKIRINGTALRIENLDSLPFPAWDEFSRAKFYRIITSRGCPYSCIFCAQASGKKVRVRSPLNVIEEIKHVLKIKKPKGFLFSDETLTLNNLRVLELCDLIIEHNLHKQIRWLATTRVDSVNYKLLKKMKQAGCWAIEFGIESGNRQILKRIKKDISLEQAIEAVKLAKKVGLHTEGAFILGHPYETKQTAYQTINFAAKLNSNLIQLGIMVPYPGTEVARMAKRGEGDYRILSYDWSDYNKQLGNALELKNLTRGDLERLQLIGYLKLFMYNFRFIGLLKFIFTFYKEMFAYLRHIFCRKKRVSNRTTISIVQSIKMLLDRNSVKYLEVSG